MASRLRLLSIFFLGGIVALTLRLFYWQVLRGDDFTTLARAQQNSVGKLSARRGNILASDGTYLAASNNAWLLFADVPNMKNYKELPDLLAPFTVDPGGDEASLSAERKRLQELLLRKDETQWIGLKNKLPTSVRDKIEEAKIEGIGFEPQEDRLYPEGSSSAHLLGFVGKDDDGLDTGYFGLEGFYDLVLAGKPGFEKKEANALGIPIISGSLKEKLAKHGIDLVTSIDKTVQLTIEKHLAKGLEQYGAKSGTIIAMNPKTGAILGMTSSPGFDPAKYWKHTSSDFINPVISYSFEPGSIVKPLVMAAGFDAGVISPDSQCDICSGPYKVDGYSIGTWDNKYYANSSMNDVIIHSDNVGMIYIGNKLGKNALYDYLEDFGFGKPTGIDLQGEMSPKMRPRDSWAAVDQATATFGQGIAVTPLQMITAFATLANDGKTVTPHVVEEMRAGDWNKKVTLPEQKQVLSKKAVDQMKVILSAAVKYGEAKWAVPKGFQVGGKTGTAQVAVSGQYDAEKTNASFIAFAPINEPKFLMLIILQEPQSSQWASETAAPLWFTIAKDLFPYLGIRPANN